MSGLQPRPNAPAPIVAAIPAELTARAEVLRAAGRKPLYGYGLALVAPEQATNLLIGLGRQPGSGTFLYLLDLDGPNHSPTFDADAARATFERAQPKIADKIVWKRSPSGLGWHGFFESYKVFPTGKLYDAAGQHVGELLGDGSHTYDPGDLTFRTLNPTENESFLSYWIIGEGGSGERWTDRVKEGARYAAGWQSYRVTRADLRTFLVTRCGPVGQHLDALFDQRKSFNRSDAAGNLMQCLLFHIHKLTPDRRGSFVANCALALAYWMAAYSYGKAGDKDYNPEKDGCALLAKVINEDPRDDSKRWRAPFWAKAHPTPPRAASEPAPAPTPARPAHRPKGDQDKHLATFRRVLEAIEPDEWGRRVYTLDYLADKMQASRCLVKPRTIQAYLKLLREAGEITTAQIGGNGRPYALLTSHFGGANKSKKLAPPAQKLTSFGDADAIAAEGVSAPQSAHMSDQCKEDHQNPSAPPPSATAVPAPAPGRAQAFGDLPPRRQAQPTPDAPVEGAPLVELVCRWLDTPLGETINPRTGEVRKRLHTASGAIDYIRERAGGRWTDTEIRRCYHQTMKRRAASAWDAERAAVLAMDDAALIKAIQSRQRALTRNIGKAREGYYRVRLEIAEQVRQWRGIEIPSQPERKVRTNAQPQALPLFAEAPAHPPPVYDAGGLIARLRARQQATSEALDAAARPILAGRT